MLEKLLDGTARRSLKSGRCSCWRRSTSPRAREVLRNFAKGSSMPELQSRAIQYLGAHGGRESRAMLAEIYGSTTDVDVKRRILRAFMVAGEKDRLFKAAQTEQNPELRAEAVRQLGSMGAHDELWQMYQKETVGRREAADHPRDAGRRQRRPRMIELAKTEKNPELRRVAVRNLGVMGSTRTGDALVEIYGSDKERRRSASTVINALFQQGTPRRSSPWRARSRTSR